MGSLRQYPFNKIVHLNFKIYSEAEIDKLSVVNITNEESINTLGHYLQDGVYDLRMGPMSVREDEICKTCFSNAIRCSGHCGQIGLPLPVFNPFLTRELEQLLRRTCHRCYKFQVSPRRAFQLIYECKLTAEGYTTEALNISDLMNSFINDGEALETNLNIDEKVDNPKKSKKIDTEESILISMKFKEAIEKYYKEITANVPADKSTTFSTRFAFQNFYKKFQADTKVGTSSNCRHCKIRLLNLHYENCQMIIKNPSKNITTDTKRTNEFLMDSVVKDAQPYLTAEQAQTILRRCWENDGILLRHIFPVLDRNDMKYPTDLLFMHKLLVVPPKFRPCNKMDGAIIEHEMSCSYKTILKLSKCLRFLVLYKNQDISEVPESVALLIKEFKGSTWIEKSHTVWHELQKSISNILDPSLGNNKIAASAKGIKQLIEKKQGLFRQNLMGKRVNFSARSVAAPDPMLAVDEVGVPMDFAIKLSYPVPVNPYNIQELRELVINGPIKHPGAIMVEDEEGKKVTLKVDDEKQRIAIANSLLTAAESCVKKVNASKIVYRHLKNGDWILMNRQPTLHKPSIQAHKARVMPNDRVLRMPYANCKAYNADFDGDELNLHFPQNELARGECHELITTQNQYLTPKDGAPLAGLIQDCVVACVSLSKRGKFFNKADYQQLVYVGVSEHHRGRIKFLPPSIIKPERMWSGKQVFSTILLNLIPEEKAKPTMKFKTSVKVDLWQELEPRECPWGGEPENIRESMTESEFILRDGELLCGIVDKCAIGSTSHGLIHTCYDLYGGLVACNVLTSIGRMSVWYLQWSGHTISLNEFVTPKNVAKNRRDELRDLIERVPYEVSKKLGITKDELPGFVEHNHLTGNQIEMALIDAAYTSVLGPTTSRVTSENEKGLYRNNLNNHMKMMVDTGAKGSKVNLNQMASLFGSVALDGKRMPMSITGKTLPSFKPYESSPRAGGYIPTRFVTGMDPKSYYFLCIVGRDSLQHTAVKTSNSGYTQRCLIKHLEGLKVCYDMTVRNSDQVVMQFDYGEDGLDVTKVPFFQNSNTLNTLVDNYSRLFKKEDIERLSLSRDAILKHKNKIIKYKKTNSLLKTCNSGFLEFCKVLQHNDNGINYAKNGLNLNAQRWHNLPKEDKLKFSKKIKKFPEPATSRYRYSASSSLEVVSEALDDLIDSYYANTYAKRPLAEQPLSKEQVAQTIHMKVLNSRVDPGEPVGALCAQALGEPLTQMTLNTFHFAGRDELNVTLGVPRMREILQMASDESMLTPIMECPFRPHVSLATAEVLKKELTPVQLAKVVHKVNIVGSLEMNFNLFRNTIIKFHFLPLKEYKKVLPLNPKKIFDYMEGTYIKKVLIRQIVMSIQKSKAYGAKSLDQKFEKDEKNIEEEDEQIEMKKIEVEPQQEASSSDEDEDNETAEDLGISGSKWQEKSREGDYNDEDDEEFGLKEGSEDEAEISLKQELKHSEDEGFVDDRQDEQKKSITKKTNSKKCKAEKSFVTEKQCRVNKVIASDNWVTDYDYDEENFIWCTVTLALPIAEGRYDLSSILRNSIENSLIHSVPNIKKALVVQNDGQTLLRTEGVNINYILKYENYLDVNRLYTNNIHTMARKFGIEAAQRTIIKEIRAVQSAYDIKVDFRHLSLLADYFTSEGTYKACSRHDLANCASPIQKMSYETCFQFLKEALLQGHTDDMSSPSANVMVGQAVHVGTNAMFDIMCKLNCVRSKS